MDLLTHKCIGGLILLVLATAAHAVPVSVANFSFESPAPAPLGSVTDWTAPAGGVDLGNAAFGFPSGSADGSQHLFLQLPGFGGTDPSSAQTNAGTIGNATAGTYTLTVAAGRRTNDSGVTDGDYIIELLAGSSVIGSFTFSDPLANWSPDSWNDISAVGAITTGSSLIGQDLGIRLSVTGGPSGGGQQGQFDNVRLHFTAVPAPASLALLVLGLGVIGAKRRALTR